MGKRFSGPLNSIGQSIGMQLVLQAGYEEAECSCDLSVGTVCQRCCEMAVLDRSIKLLTGAVRVLDEISRDQVADTNTLR